MDWFKNLPRSTQAVIITIVIAILTLFGVNATFVVDESEPPPIVEVSTDIEVGEIVIVEPEE